MDILKPIETIYNGYRFRSRLEARWAVFFDTLGVPYEYEKEGYNLDGTYYLPDFWLPEQRYWIEIKGQEPSKEEKMKAWLLAQHANDSVFILWQGCNVPAREKMYLYPSPAHFHHEVRNFCYRRCRASFDAPFDIPFPFNDNKMLFERTEKEKEIIAQWCAKTSYDIEDVPLSTAKALMSFTEDYPTLGIRCDKHHNVTVKFSYIDEDEDEDMEYIRQSAIDKIQSCQEIKDFLSEKPGWYCYFNDGRYLVTGWEECTVCHSLSLGYGLSCEKCNQRPLPRTDMESPRLIAAYTAARRARFEHGEKGR